MTRVHWVAGREHESTVRRLSFIKAVEECCCIGRVLLSLRQERLGSFLNLGGCAESFSLMLVFVMTGPRAEGGPPLGEIGSWGFMGEGHRPPTLPKNINNKHFHDKTQKWKGRRTSSKTRILLSPIPLVLRVDNKPR